VSREDPGPRRRLVRTGEKFTSGELNRGEIELEKPDPRPEPPGGGTEPWARLADLPAKHPVRDWLRRLRHGD